MRKPKGKLVGNPKRKSRRKTEGKIGGEISRKIARTSTGNKPTLDVAYDPTAKISTGASS